MKNITLLRLREIKHLKIIMDIHCLYSSYIDKVFGEFSYDTKVFLKCIVNSVYDVFDRNWFNKDLQCKAGPIHTYSTLPSVDVYLKPFSNKCISKFHKILFRQPCFDQFDLFLPEYLHLPTFHSRCEFGFGGIGKPRTHVYILKE